MSWALKDVEELGWWRRGEEPFRRRGLCTEHHASSKHNSDFQAEGSGFWRGDPNHAHLPFLPGANFSLRELGLGEVTPPHGTLYRTDIGLPHCGYSMGASSDADVEADTVLSPEHPVQLWGRSTRSGRSSCLSSRANSNLTLTDTEHENTETGEWPARPVPGAWLSRPGFSLQY